MNLLNNWCVTGRDLNDFKKEVDNLVNSTKSITSNNETITLLSRCRCKEAPEGSNLYYVLSRIYLDKYLNGDGLKLGAIANNVFSDELFEEMDATTGLCAIIENEKFLIGSNALATLTMRAGVGGEVTVARNNVIRDTHFADALTSIADATKFIYREDEDGNKKIFACMSKGYNEIPMSILYHAIDKVADEDIMGKMEVNHWEISHNFTDIYVEFPEAAQDFMDTYKLSEKIIPGLFLCTSDTGASSVIVRGTYRYKNRCVITDEVARKHSGTITAEELLDMINNQVFTKFRLLPEKLADLIGQTVVDYSKVDLSSTAGQEANRTSVAALIKTLVNSDLKELKGQKRRAELIECMVSEINPTIPYTMYDIAMMFMWLPDRLNGLDKATMANVAKACAKVPFEIENRAKKLSSKPEEDEILYLV